jgi:hypothetical protein
MSAGWLERNRKLRSALFPEISNRMTAMPDQGLAIESGGSRFGWFVAGAFSVGALVAAFLLANER